MTRSEEGCTLQKYKETSLTPERNESTRPSYGEDETPNRDDNTALSRDNQAQLTAKGYHKYSGRAARYGVYTKLNHKEGVTKFVTTFKLERTQGEEF